MKSFITCMITLILLIGLTTTTLAGSIPEDLRLEGQIFFAKIIEFNENEDNEKSTVELIPVKVIKGDVQLGEQLCYTEAIPVGEFEIKNNEVYLITYYDEVNPTYILRSTSYDTKNLTLPDVNQYDMWNRFQTYLNNGTYDELEIQRQKELGILNAKMQIEDELPELDNSINNTVYSTAIPIGVIIVGIIISINIIKKKKQK